MEFKLSEEQLNVLLDASKPVLCMKIGNAYPRSVQGNANRAWEKLGKEIGFDHMTVAPVLGKSNLFFTAKSKAPAAVRPDNDKSGK